MKKKGGIDMKKSEERKRKLKASSANIALFLSIFAVLFPLAMPNVSATHNPTIYVDDDGSDLGDGSPGNPYNEIEKALDDAFDDTGVVLILVYNGTYDETLTIGTGAWDTLTLQGNHSSNTTIDAQGTGTVISISASWVNVTGFTYFGLLL
jgi:hypothetical protein